MTFETPIQEMPRADLLVGITLALVTVVDQLSKSDPEVKRRLSNQLDEIIQHLASTEKRMGVISPLLLFRTWLEGDRSYKDVEEMVRTALNR